METGKSSSLDIKTNRPRQLLLSLPSPWGR